MAICNWCKKDMLIVDGCAGNAVVEYPDGEDLPSIPFQPRRGVLNCADCAVLPGHAHHPGCAKEICPRCGGQLIVCGCLEPVNEDDEEDEDGGDEAEEPAPLPRTAAPDKRWLN
jgi:hypothetical protein